MRRRPAGNPFLSRHPASGGSGRFLWPALAFAALFSAAAFAWHARTAGPCPSPPGTPFPVAGLPPGMAIVAPLEPDAALAAAAPPARPVPLPDPLDLDAAAELARTAYPEPPLPPPPPAPPPRPTTRRRGVPHEAEARARERCRALTAAALLDGLDPPDVARLAEACRHAR